MTTLSSTTADAVEHSACDRTLVALAADASLEISPEARRAEASSLAELPPGTCIYLPFTARAKVDETLAACRSLAEAGLRPVPHLAARAVPGRRWLRDWLERLSASAVDSLFLVAGDLDRPKGPFGDTLQILDTGLLARHGFERIGVAGHPEGHPAASGESLQRALLAKADYARESGTEMWLVTQFLFAAEPLVRWLRAVDEAGIDLPVRVGVPGPGHLATLVRFALRCGIGASARMLLQRPDIAWSFAGRWTPDELVGEIASHHAADGAGRLAGIHVFPFGGMRASVEWLGAVRDGATRPCARIGA